MNFLLVENLTKSYGEKLLFQNITFGIDGGRKVALIARNGAGKTSLLNIIIGKDIPDEGKVTFRKDIRMAYLPQNPELDEEASVLDVLFNSDNKYVQIIKRYEHVLEKIKKQDDENTQQEMHEIIEEMDKHQCWDYENRVKEILFKLNVTDFEQKIKYLSGGQRKKVALSKVLIDEVDLLILDEPTNHLDIQMIEWLEEFLSKQNLTLLLVTHDRYFLDNVCNEIIEIDNQQIYSYKGNYNYFLEKKAEREFVEAQELEKNKNLYRRELEWMRQTPSARSTKARARINAFYELKEKASKRIEAPKAELKIKAERVGGKILEIYNISKSYDEKKLVDDFSYVFKKGERIGIVGANGAGKSTLLNMITGNIKPDDGKVIIGQTTQFGYYTQEGLKEKDDMRVIDIVKEIAEVIRLEDGHEISASQFLNYFQFPHTTQYNYYGNLSGGERRRLFLLKTLMANPNFLILDEPTNDLDVFTLMMLEDFLQQFGGCLIIVSHDRSFMDNLVDHLFVFEGDGKIKDYHSTYTEYTQEKLRKEKELRAVNKDASKDAKREKPVSDVQKMNFKEKQEFEALEKDMELLETEKSELLQKMNSGEGSSQELVNWGKRYDEVCQSLDVKTDRWLELSEKKQ